MADPQVGRSEAENSEEIVFEHTYSPQYQLHPATGIAGGIQPQGNFKIDFTLDHNPNIQSENYSVTKE